METLKLSKCIKIGYFHKPHGVAGTLQLNFDAEWEDSLANASVLVTETEGLPLPWFIADEGIRIISPTTALIDLDWIDDEKDAKRLCGQNVFLEKGDIREPTSGVTGGEWVGYTLIGEDGISIGLITGEDNYAGNLVLSVITSRGTILVPFHPDLLKQADHTGKKLILDLPSGILDL